MAGVGKLIKQAQKMQKKMEALQEELGKQDIEVSSGGGAISIKISLQQEVRSVTIDPEFLKEDKDFIEETLTEAINEALKASKSKSEEAMGEVTSGFQMPGFM